jgi:hypothetical protein
MANLKIEHLCWYCTATSETECRLISIHFFLPAQVILASVHAERRLVATGFEIEGYPDLVVGRQIADLRQTGEG